MTVLYVDSSALLKRVILEAESSRVRALLRDRAHAREVLTASSLAWVEVWRALRRAGTADVEALVRAALSGIAEFPLDEAVLLRARRVGPDSLRTLDAVHLASALAVGADELLTYDERLAAAAGLAGIEVLAPTE